MKIKDLLPLSKKNKLIMIFVVSALFYPIINDAKLFLTGDKVKGTVTRKVLEYSQESYISYGNSYYYYGENSENTSTGFAPISIIEFEFNNQQYTVRSGPWDGKEKGDKVSIYFDSSEMKDYTIFSFGYLYLTGKGWNIVFAFIALGLVLNIQSDYKNRKQRSKRNSFYKVLFFKIATIALMLVPLVAYLMGGYDYFIQVFMIWIVLPIFILIYQFNFSDRAMAKKKKKRGNIRSKGRTV